MQQSKKILYLESLRGIAAMSVAIFHFQINSILNNKFTDNGWIMVDFFFVLSGFVIALNYQLIIKSFSDLYFFQIKRFLRLYPLHFFTLIIFLVIEFLKNIAESEFGLIANNPSFSSNNYESFLFNLFLLQNIIQDELTWNGPSWSISAEFYTYIIFGFICIFIGRSKFILITLLSIFCLSCFVYLMTQGMSHEQGFIRCLYSFFLGVISWNIQKNFDANINNFYSYFFLVLSFVLIINIPNNQSILGPIIPIIFCFFIFFLTLTDDDNYLKKFLNNKFLIYIGTISYGIYMIHSIIWWIFNQIIRFTLPNSVKIVDGVSKVVIDDFLLSNLIMIIGLSFILLISHLSYQFIEAPINNFRRRL